MTVDMQSADMADSGQYDRLEEERREVQAEESEPSADEIINQALESSQEQQVEKGDDDANQNVQEELLKDGTITPDTK